MPKKILFIHEYDDWKNETPGIDGVYNLKGYEVFSELAIENNAQIYRSFYKNINPDTALISKVWTFIQGQWQKQEVNFTPDLIIDRTPASYVNSTLEFRLKLSQNVKILNDPNFSTLIADKYNQYLLFKDLMRQTSYIKNYKQLINEMSLYGSKIVLKDLSGEGGKGVLILEKNKVSIDFAQNLQYPLILQDFLQSEKGIPGINIVKSDDIIVADLRIMTIGRKIMFAVSRIAKKNSLYTNLAQGAIFEKVDIIPEYCILAVNKITEKLNDFGANILGIDFMFDNEGNSFLIEINSKPGLSANLIVSKDIQKNYLDQILQELN